MRTKNKMKDSNVEFEEWWEVAKEYFSKFEKYLAQHRSMKKSTNTSWRYIRKPSQILYVKAQQAQKH
jgi:hypothetical protein